MKRIPMSFQNSEELCCFPQSASLDQPLGTQLYVGTAYAVRVHNVYTCACACACIHVCTTVHVRT